MPTVINNPGNTEAGNPAGMIITIVAVLAIVFLFFVYGLPMLRNSSQPQAPQAPQMNIPEQVDVNVNSEGQ